MTTQAPPRLGPPPQLEDAVRALRLAVQDARSMTRDRRRVKRFVVLRVEVLEGDVTEDWKVEPAHLGADVLKPLRRDPLT